MNKSIYDHGISIRDHIRTADNLLTTLKQDKYDLLLEFINKWLKLEGDKRLKELSKFRYISERDLTKNKKYNCNLIREYIDRLKDKLGVDLPINKDTPDSKIKRKYILHIVRKCAIRVDYILRSKNIKDEKYYSLCIRKSYSNNPSSMKDMILRYTNNI